MGLLKRTPPPLVGLDISTTAVKLLGLSEKDGKYKVDAYAVVPLPPDSVSERNIVNVEAVGDAVARAVAKSRTKHKHGAVAVSGSSVITKVIAMQANLPDSEMEVQISLEADQYIPYSLDEVYLDYEVLGVSKNNPDSVDVLLAAARSDTVDQRREALEVGGLSASVVDIEAFSMETAFSRVSHQLPEGGKGKTVAVVDVGAMATTLNVLRDGHSIFTREQLFGGKQLTDDIQARYGLTYEEAGRAKKQGGLPDDYEPEILNPFKESLAQQVSRLLQIFFSSTSQSQVDHIILCGGTASIPGVGGVVEQYIGVPTLLANPLANMSFGPTVNAQAVQNDASSLMIACGLALRTFDHGKR